MQHPSDARPAAATAPAARPLYRELLIFALIGVGGALVDMAILAAAMEGLGASFYAGRVLSYLGAASFTWYMNRVFTFHSRGRPGAVRQWATFLAANAVGGAVNYGTSAAVVFAGTHWVVLPDIARVVLPYAAVATGSLAGMSFNFVASKWVVFRRG